MRIQDLFTIPEGEKATEKVFSRVLISSVCGILLCMTCLVSTTWAWFTAGVENEENWINIGSPEMEITVENEKFDSGDKLAGGENAVVITHAGDADDFQQKSTLYVTLTVEGADAFYVVLDGENDYRQALKIQIPAGEKCKLSGVATWFKPDNVQRLSGDTVTVTQEDLEALEQEVTENTEPTEATDPTEATIPETTEEAPAEETQEQEAEEIQ